LFKIPEGWTDDMNITVGGGHNLEELVDYVLETSIRSESTAAMAQHLSEEFGLSPADAELARDRVYGGVVRAASRQKANRPAKDKDPLAWISYNKCLKRPELIAAIYPQFPKPQPKPWWRRLLSKRLVFVAEPADCFKPLDGWVVMAYNLDDAADAKQVAGPFSSLTEAEKEAQRLEHSD